MSSLSDLVKLLDAKQQAEAMEMLKQHKDYPRLLALVKENQEARLKQRALPQKEEDDEPPTECWHDRVRFVTNV
jgi:hypothetical protein